MKTNVLDHPARAPQEAPPGGPALEALAWIHALASEWEDRRSRAPAQGSLVRRSARDRGSRLVAGGAVPRIAIPSPPISTGLPGGAVPLPPPPTARGSEAPGTLGRLAS